MSCRYDIECADQVGVILVPASHAREPGLRLAIVFRHMATGRTRPAGVAWRHRQHLASAPCLLVLKLPPELAPPLIENGLIQAGLDLDVASWQIGTACR